MPSWKPSARDWNVNDRFLLAKQDGLDDIDALRRAAREENLSYAKVKGIVERVREWMREASGR